MIAMATDKISPIYLYVMLKWYREEVDNSVMDHVADFGVMLNPFRLLERK